MLSSNLRLDPQSDLFPSGYPTKTLYYTSPVSHVPYASPISFFSEESH